jgi:hypothetical protein
MEATEPKPTSFAAELPDDLTWLADHQGAPYTLHTCRMVLRDLAPAIDKHERDLAEARHALGTRIIELITHGAVATMQRTTIAEFFETDCGLAPDEAYDYIRFAKGATAEQASLYRFSRCRVGISLVQQLGRRDLGELAKTPIEVTDEDGQPVSVAFTPKTPVSKLRWTLARLRDSAKPRAAEETPSRAVARRLRELNELVADFLGRHPVLAAANPKVTLYAGAARVQHRPLTTNDEFAAAAKLYAELAKIR